MLRESTDALALDNSAWTLARLMEGGTDTTPRAERLQAVLDAGVMPKLVEQLVYFLCCGGRGGKRERRAGVDEAEAGRKSRFGRGGRVRVGQGAQAGRRRRVEEWEVDVGRVGRHFSRSDER